ncbi:MAG TPA: hypothetical protein VMF11_04335 [Candidatus Baltobacteraceae bacterium]|nr:hypothetical protein [Candidatus Baltobacteraceae bacterium]
MTYIAPSLKSFAPEDTRVFRDCRPATGFINVAFSGFPTNLGDELAHVEVIPTGPNPDVDFETDLAGYVAIGERWDVIKALDAFAEGVERILGLF